jgi:spermidine synthase
VGQLLTEFSGKKAKKNVAVLGLGIGTLAAYGEKGQDFTFYEIDPAVKDIAANPAYFTFLQDCKAAHHIILGDGRLKIEEAPDRSYGIIILDAFTSDAIPVHLLTREALQLYLSKLEDTGIIVFNITNRYVFAEPLLESLAEDAGLAALYQSDDYDGSIEKYDSKWVIMSRDAANFGNLRYDDRWQVLSGWNPAAVWTDDFSNILGIIEWL